VWRTDRAFVPVIQSFGANGTKYAQFRLPTMKEERYMIFSALQIGIDGMFFWSYYASDPTWRTNVFDPIMSEVRDLLPSIRAGAIPAVTSNRARVVVSLYRDPVTKRYSLVAVNLSGATLRPTVTISNAIPVKVHKFTPTFKPYEVRTLRY